MAATKTGIGRAAGIILLAVMGTSCASDASSSGDKSISMALSNAGTEPLRCRLMFGHWVDKDLGELAPGTSVDLSWMQSAKDGALYVMRADGQRQMMIETIQCARLGRWMETFGQIDLAPIRSRRARAIEASCAAPAGEGPVACRLDRIEQ